jgi:hypothetical protein
MMMMMMMMMMLSDRCDSLVGLVECLEGHGGLGRRGRVAGETLVAALLDNNNNHHKLIQIKKHQNFKNKILFRVS